MSLTPLPFLLSMLLAPRDAVPDIGPKDPIVRAALTKAREEKKALLLYFFITGYCPTCARLDTETFADPAWKEWSDRRCTLLPIYLDDDTNKAWKEFGVVQSHTLILLRSDGRELERWVGFYDADTLSWLIDWDLSH